MACVCIIHACFRVVRAWFVRASRKGVFRVRSGGRSERERERREKREEASVFGWGVFRKIQTDEVSVFARLAPRPRSRVVRMDRLGRGVIGSGRARTIRVRPILYMRWACGRGEGHARTTRQRVRARSRGARTNVGRLAGATLHAASSERKMSARGGASRRARSMRARTKYASRAPIARRAAKYWMIVMATMRVRS